MVDRIKKIQIREKLIFPEACAYNKKDQSFDSDFEIVLQIS